MNVQLFGNIDNKTYQAPRINLMQKVQEKGATPLTFKETIKGLNDANVSVSISDEGLKAFVFGSQHKKVVSQQVYLV